MDDLRPLEINDLLADISRTLTTVLQKVDTTETQQRNGFKMLHRELAELSNALQREATISRGVALRVSQLERTVLELQTEVDSLRDSTRELWRRHDAQH